MTKAEAIQKVNDSAGSLFTKQDVINLINEIESEKSKIDLDDLYNRIESIIDDANTSDIELDSDNCSFEIERGNRITIEEAKFDTDTYTDSIKHDIRELISATERGEACLVDEES